MKQRQTATETVEAAYGAALAQADSNQQVQVRREVGDLYAHLLDAKLRNGLVLFPVSTDGDEGRRAVLRAQLLKLFGRDVAKARDAYVHCLLLASQLGSKRADGPRCEAQIRALDALTPVQKRDKALDEWRYVRLEPSKRARRATASTPACVFSGSAESTSWTKLYDEATGSDFRFLLEDFDVASLELPQRTGQRARVLIDYPFKASGYVDADSVLVTAARVDLLPRHLWLDPDSSVQAFAAASGQASLSRSGFGQSTPAVTVRVPCTSLRLVSARPPVTASAKGETSQISGVVPLFDAPAGKAIGQVDLDFALNVRVLERKPGWVHVNSSDAGAVFAVAPYQFDAWIAEKAPRELEAFGLGVLQAETTAPTHVTTALLPLRLSPNPGAPVVTELVPGVALILGGDEDGMRRIRFNEAHGNNEGNDFWVTAADFTAKTKAR